MEDAARARRCDPQAWSRALARRLGAWAPAVVQPAVVQGAPAEDLATIVLAVTHPALRPATGNGMLPTFDVPAWASSALRHADLRDVSRALFPERTRTVDLATGGLLTQPVDGQLSWWSLAVATAFAGAITPDDVARLLEHRLVSERLPEVEDVAAVRSLSQHFDRDDAFRIAVGALAAGADGVGALLTVAWRSADIARLPASERPRRLAELVAYCRSFDRPAATPPAPSRSRTAPPPAPARRALQRPGWRAARAAPDAALVPTSRRVVHDELRRALDGLIIDDIVLETPRSPEELRTWAEILDNCLASFEGAVSRRQSLVVGVRSDGRLVAALEIDPAALRLRQFHGPHNRPPAPGIARAVLPVLAAHGITVA